MRNMIEETKKILEDVMERCKGGNSDVVDERFKQCATASGTPTTTEPTSWLPIPTYLSAMDVTAVPNVYLYEFIVSSYMFS